MRDDLRGLRHLLQGLAQLADDLPLVRHAEFDEVDRIAHEQAGVVEGVVELVGDARGELAERGELAGLDELLLFVAQLLLAPLHFGRGLPQVTHDVDHRLPAVLQTQVGPGEPAAILLVVDENMEHRLALVAEAPVDLIKVAHDVEHGAALLVPLAQAPLQRLHLGAESTRGWRGRAGLGDGRRRGDLLHHDPALPVPQAVDVLRRLSSAFSKAIILSSRPTTTSSNFSRSRIFSCNSVLDFSRSHTTCSYSRMSRKMPMAPITLPSGSRRAEALRVVGITSPLALRGLSRALRVTPRSTTSRRAARNPRVSSGEMMRESDCSISSSGRKPRRANTASLAWRILPSRSETNTGSGAFLIKLSA